MSRIHNKYICNNCNSISFVQEYENGPLICLVCGIVNNAKKLPDVNDITTQINRTSLMSDEEKVYSEMLNEYNNDISNLFSNLKVAKIKRRKK